MNQKTRLTFVLMDLDYEVQEDGNPVIKIYGKNNDEQICLYINDFLPYLYVEKNKDLEYILKNDPEISRWQRGEEEIVLRHYFWSGEDIKLTKLYGKDPRKITTINSELKKLGLVTYESDIPFLKRFLLDNNLKCLNAVVAKVTILEQKGNKIIAEASYKDLSMASLSVIPSTELFYKMKVMAIDIKTAREEESLEKALLKKEKRIITISVVWGNGVTPENGKLFLLQEESDADEKRMIMDFVGAIQKVQPDILITYRGDTFDFPCLFARMKKLAIPNHLLTLFQDSSVYYSRNLLCYRIKGRISFDLALRTWGIHPPSGKKELYDIAQEVLGRGAFEEKNSKEGIWEKQESQGTFLRNLWKGGILERKYENLKRLAKCCLHDCKLIYDLYWELGMTGWMETLRTTGFPPAEASNCTERINGEFELMRYMRRKGILIPPRPSKEQVEQNRQFREKHPHEGGTVLYPEGTLHTGVVIADFRSMYPSVMIAHNIGGETLNHWVNGVDYGNPKKLFSKETRSCLSIMEETLITKRIEKKKQIAELTKQMEQIRDKKEQRKVQELLNLLEREQSAMKIVANSMYGAHFYIRSRFYTQILAGAIADSARTYLLGVKESLAKVSQMITPCNLIYGDTDSTFIKILNEKLFLDIYMEKNPERKKALISELIDIVGKILKELNTALPPPLELKLEDIAYRVIFKPQRKKAYGYTSLLNEAFEVKGFEAVRSDWSPLARIAQKKVLEIILRQPKIAEQIITNENAQKKDEFQIGKQFLIALGVKVLQMPTEELLPKVTTLTPIKQHPLLYKGKTPAIVAFLDFAKKEQLNVDKEWMIYDKFPWVITTGKGLIYDRARHPKYVHDIDREYYVTEILRCCEDFGVKVSLNEVKGALPTGRIDLLLNKTNEKIPEQPVERTGALDEEILTILPLKKGELEWKGKKNGRKKKARHFTAENQALLSIFTTACEQSANQK